VAYVDKKQRAKLLDTAAQEHLTVKALRENAPKKATKTVSPKKQLARKNAKLIKEQSEIIKFLKRMKNPMVLAEWFDVLNAFMTIMPDVLALCEEAALTRDAARAATEAAIAAEDGAIPSNRNK
jgi:hypothetical protein